MERPINKRVPDQNAAQHSAEPFIREIPPSLQNPAPLSHDNRIEPQSELLDEEEQEADSGPLKTRLIIVASQVEQYIDQLDRSVWRDLVRAFKASSLVCRTPVEFHERPSFNLEDLYRLCLGPDWQTAAFLLSTRSEVTSLEFMLSLIGAALYSRVLCTTPPWAEESLVTLRSAYHEAELMKLMNEAGTTYSICESMTETDCKGRSQPI